MTPAAWQEAERELHTLGDCLRFLASSFAAARLHFGHGADDPWDEAVQLLLGTFALPDDRLQSLLASRLLPSELARLLGLARRRIDERVPIAYLTGRACFAGLWMQVDPRVLIPRSPIAELIEGGFAPWFDAPPKRVLDLCTGSGAIGLACAKFFPSSELVLSDLSADALLVAEANRVRLGLDAERVRLRQGDLFAPVEGRFDLILSNPPYVPESSYRALPPEYLHEPRLALVAEDDGLAIVKRILHAAPDYLTDDGWLFCEVGELAPAVGEWLVTAVFEWVEFERGGDGVLAIAASALRQFVQSAH